MEKRISIMKESVQKDIRNKRKKGLRRVIIYVSYNNKANVISEIDITNIFTILLII